MAEITIILVTENLFVKSPPMVVISDMFRSPKFAMCIRHSNMRL